jgi:hypothetical protein
VVASVTITSPTLLPKEGDAVQLTAVARDQYGAIVSGTTATWSVSDTRLAAISTEGILNAYHEGSVVATAAVNGVSGTQTFTINPIRLSVTIGSTKEVVFQWATDRCGDLDTPDQPARFVRADDGGLVLINGNAPAVYLSRGTDFNSLRRDCSQPALVSADRINAESYENQEWLWVVYREGSKWHALIHNEYHDPIASTCMPGVTSPRNWCWYNSITYAVSVDAGHTFAKPLAPAHTVAPAPNAWVPPLPGERPPGCCFAEGYRTPGNIVRANDGYHYALILEFPTKYSDGRGVCVMRTNTLDDPASWRAWDGTGFNLRMTSPYVTGSPAPLCAFLDEPAGDVGTILYDTYLERYVHVMTGCGFFYSLSSDLIHWSKPQLLAEVNSYCSVAPDGPNVLERMPSNYPAIIDHADTTINFERAGRTTYLYYVRFNRSTSDPLYSLDRDLVRVPLTFTRLD